MIGKYFPKGPEYAAYSSLLNKNKPTHTFLSHNALHTNLQACVYAAFPSVSLPCDIGAYIERAN